MAQGIYINVAAQNPAAAFVISELNPTPVEFYTIVLGDNNSFNIHLVDGVGGFSSISGVAGYAISFLIGRLGATAVAAQGTWTLITSGWTASVDFNTVEFAALFNGASEIEAYAQITITGADATVRTYGQGKIRVKNYVVTPGSGIPVPVVDYLTSAQTYAIFTTLVQHAALTAFLTPQRGSGPPYGQVTGRFDGDTYWDTTTGPPGSYRWDASISNWYSMA